MVYQGETPLNFQHTLFFFIFLLLFICAYKDWFISPHCPHPLPQHTLLKNGGQEGKAGPAPEYQWEVEGYKGEGGQICWIYFIFIYEKRTMKLAEIVLRRGGDEG
jgi:hypothetical protein